MKEFKIRCSSIGEIMGNAKVKGELSTTCISYLKKWYSEQKYGYPENIRSKYLDKGVMCEDEAIDAVCEVLHFGFLTKNNRSYSNEYIQGTPDIITKTYVIDTKCSWDGKTFLDSVSSPINSDYEWQLQGYMSLVNVKKAMLAYVLLDTPESVNFGEDVIYSHIDINERVFALEIDFCKQKEVEIIEKVKKCREWLQNYDLEINKKLAK